MNINEVSKLMEKNIKELEKQVYNFETVAIPRYNADKQVLSRMRQEYLRVLAIREKLERKEEVSKEEFAAAIPESFRM